MSAATIPGAEPWSQHGSTGTGVLALHGFTGNPSSVRMLADAAAAEGHDVELPLLPGHGTVVEDMFDTTWVEYTETVADAHARLADRVDRVVATGLSMGGSLALWTALERVPVDALVLINPATVPQSPDVIEMVREMVADGTELAPGIGSDIADPDAEESAYPGTPLRPLLSFQLDGLSKITSRFGELTMPLLLMTSRQDHVVDPSDSEHLAASYGGPVEHVWLERSYHVATKDYDRDEIVRRAMRAVDRVGADALQPGVVE